MTTHTNALALKNAFQNISSSDEEMRKKANQAVNEFFRDLFSPPDHEGHKQAVLTIKANPAMVVQAMQNYRPTDSQFGLTLKGQADVVDLTLGCVTNEEATEMLRNHLTPDRVTELLRARGDLPSIAANVADVEMLQAVLVEELTKHKDDKDEVQYSAGFQAFYWAMKLVDHPEYEKLLQTDLVGGTFVEFVVMGAYLMVFDSIPESRETDSDNTGHFEVDRNDDNGNDENDDEDYLYTGLMASMLEKVNIDIETANKCLDALIDRGFDPDDIDEEVVEEALAAINERRRNIDEAPQVVAAEEAADDLDF